MTNLNVNYSEASKLAEAIYDFIDLYGISELDGIKDLLTGETSTEDFIQQVEDDLTEQRG